MKTKLRLILLSKLILRIRQTAKALFLNESRLIITSRKVTYKFGFLRITDL